jgi:hypothetical protein
MPFLRPMRARRAVWLRQFEERKQAMYRNFKTLCLGLFAAFAVSALVASAAQAASADFKSGAANAFVHIAQDPDEPFQKFSTPVGTLTCEEVTDTGNLAAQSAELTSESISYQKCHLTALKFPVTVDTNGCHLKFTAGATGGPGFSEGSLHIENCVEAKGITITVFNNADHKEEHRICTMHMFEQTVSPVNYYNRHTSGKREEVTIEANAVKIKASTTHSEISTLCSGITHEFEAQYTGRMTASTTVCGTPVDFTAIST